MSFLSDSALKASLAARLKVSSVNDLDAYWDAIIPRANAAAYQDIQGSLLKRGFTTAQVDQWDRGTEFQEAIGLYYCIVNGGLYAGYDQRSLQALDRRKELLTVQVFVSGRHIVPEESPGVCSTGGPDLGGVFNWPDRDDPSRYTRW